MRKSLAIVPLFALVAACSGGPSGTTMLPGTSARGALQPGGASRHPQSITNFSYTLASASYPSGYSPSCGTSLNIYWTNVPDGGTTTSDVFSFGGGIPWTVYVGPCHAAAGDSMTVTITDVYGHITSPSHPSPGNFTVNDTGNDSHATLLVKDNTTGASVTTDIWYSY